MQLFIPNIGESFVPLMDALTNSFLLALFQGVGEIIPGQGVIPLTFKQAGLALLEPTNTSPENWKVSCVITGHLVAALRVREELQTADHALILREGQDELRGRNVLQLEAALEKTLTISLPQYHDACNM